MGSDREEVVAVLIRYARAVDTKDWELLRTCFTQDATCDYGDIGSWRGADDLVVFMRDAHLGMGPTKHLVTNFQVDVTGERASSLSYVHAVTVLASHPDDWIDTVGSYDDQLHCGPGGWQIARRTFRTTRTMLSPSLTPKARPAERRRASP
ncbi:MAG: nuclear transport factor 2 family protein [Acidimicrobiales bacterium]|jgi:3-phenylpropionate/cinnamic acid dioxygenase small subunit